MIRIRNIATGEIDYISPDSIELIPDGWIVDINVYKTESEDQLGTKPGFNWLLLIVLVMFVLWYGRR